MHNTIATVRFTEDGSTFHFLRKMPEGKKSHCMTVLSGGNIFVAGGYESKSCFLFKSETNEWTRCPGKKFTNMNHLLKVLVQTSVRGDLVNTKIRDGSFVVPKEEEKRG